ncbi:MAG: alpha-glucan family phosphorylase, partial [Candidatus Nanohaloarchaea archaeon]
MTRSVAYFSMEIGIKPEIKTYSGGLGILAGDTLKSAADLGEDFTAVTLLYRNGYFSQKLENNFQTEGPDGWDYGELLEDTGLRVELDIFGESVDVKVWRYTIESESDVDILFLDTGLDSNSGKVRALTSSLYGGDNRMRLGQEVLLGIGGARALESAGAKPDFYHMNEGHSALLTIEAEGEFIFTTHTPVAAGHDKFSKSLVEDVMGKRAEELEIDQELNMTEQALKNAEYCNAVSEKHQEVSSEMFPDYELSAVTNGVHSESWTSDHFQELFDEHVGGWRRESERLSQALKIPDNEIWDAKNDAKRELSELVEERTGKDLDEDILTVGFARRMTGY